MVYITHEPILFLLEDRNPERCGVPASKIYLINCLKNITGHLSKRGLSDILEKEIQCVNRQVIFQDETAGGYTGGASIKYP